MSQQLDIPRRIDFEVYQQLHTIAKRSSGGDLHRWINESIKLATSYLDALSQNNRLVFETSPGEFEPADEFDTLRTTYVSEIPLDDNTGRAYLSLDTVEEFDKTLDRIVGLCGVTRNDFFNAAFALKICHDRCKEMNIGMYLESDHPAFGRVLMPIEKVGSWTIVATPPHTKYVQ